jgi:hypothetical protein
MGSDWVVWGSALTVAFAVIMLVYLAFKIGGQINKK